MRLVEKLDSKGLRDIYVCRNTLGNLNAYKTDDTGWDMYLIELCKHTQL
jgi:hypothetical protein